MDEPSGILVIIAVLVLLYFMWNPAKGAYGASSGCPLGCRCPYCRKKRMRSRAHSLCRAYEGVENKDQGDNLGLADDVDTKKEQTMHDPSEFYESEDQILQGGGSGYNHQDVIPEMALEGDVQTSHDAYVQELRGRTTTASKQTVLDSFNPPNIPWGLTGFRGFRQMGPSSGSRTVPSETSSQALEFASFNHTPFCL